MPPVGNDVVDLKYPENRGKSRDERFVGRVFTENERDRIEGALCPDRVLWALWASKEAAFKLVSRGDPAVNSIPRRYAVLLDPSAGSESCLAGRVITPRGELALRIIVTEDYVHALSAETDDGLDRMIHRVDPMDVHGETGDASAFVRRRLLCEIARSIDCPVGELSIGKEPLGPGAPFVLHREHPLAVDISLSHDGRFSAFAFIVRKNP